MEMEVRIEVFVAREDLPETSVKVQLGYRSHSSQSQWPQFLVQVREALRLESVHLVLERLTLLPVLTVLQLRNGGSYLVRPTEASNLLEWLASDRGSCPHSWPIIDRGKLHSLTYRSIVDTAFEARSSLAVAVDDFTSLKERANAVIARPQRQIGETRLAREILAAASLEDLAALLKDSALLDRVDVRDKVSLFRLAFDSAERLWPESARTDARFWLLMIQRSMSALQHEPDVVVSGVRLLGVIQGALGEELNSLIHLILDAAQLYSPPSPVFQPRVIRRLKGDQDNEVIFGVNLSKHTIKVGAEEGLSEATSRDVKEDLDRRDCKLNSPSDAYPQYVAGSSPSRVPSPRAAPSVSVPARKGWSRTKGDTNKWCVAFFVYTLSLIHAVLSRTKWVMALIQQHFRRQEYPLDNSELSRAEI